MFTSDAAKLFQALDSSTVNGEAVETFRAWVNCKVLPAIFATGGYILNPECVSSAMVSDMDRMPLPFEAGPMLAALAQDDRPITYTECRAQEQADLVGNERQGKATEQASVSRDLAYDEAFFRQVRELKDHPAVRDLNEYVDAVLLPAIFHGGVAASGERRI